MTTMRRAPRSAAVSRTCCNRLLPARRCSAFGNFDRMRVPLPAAMITMSSANSVVAMRRPLLRAAIIAALCLAFASLSGCSAIRLAYGQADGLVFRWLDRYVDFDGPQAYRVREALGAWFAWHRRTQLPDYAELLTSLETDVLADTTAARVCALWSEVRQRIDRGFD